MSKRRQNRPPTRQDACQASGEGDWISDHGCRHFLVLPFLAGLPYAFIPGIFSVQVHLRDGGHRLRTFATGVMARATQGDTDDM